MNLTLVIVKLIVQGTLISMCCYASYQGMHDKVRRDILEYRYVATVDFLVDIEYPAFIKYLEGTMKRSGDKDFLRKFKGAASLYVYVLTGGTMAWTAAFLFLNTRIGSVMCCFVAFMNCCLYNLD